MSSSSNALVNFKDIHCHVLVRGDRKTIQKIGASTSLMLYYKLMFE